MSMELYLLNFLITKTFSDQFGVYPLAKIFLYLEILTWSSSLNLGSLSLTSFLKSRYVLSLTSTGSILIVLWHVLFTHPLYHLIYRYIHFSTPKSWILVFNVLINLSATTDFPSLCIEKNCCKIHFAYQPRFFLVFYLNHLKFFESHQQY